ncbi:putative ATPase/DNA-binding CsgD family transcriptional regulator [Streptomyces phaeochromogenes]|uniref:ATP-binding protein n=1 Tax=Streptomyces phaeochromogenes TaxID=1923 RepID=UPI00278D635D|nr:LuxR C-terminal-related transcriptional regulator [Streptomyces phaeochromogenes]MDQ0949970.1 putative ATPase/DNA-binding CsgD family transcriptional regulator [Streptomyces phaeochromogenes]
MGGSAPRRVHQPPVETTSFVDRRDELAEGRRLLATARLVTLTGPGGVGKTRLAGRIAARVERAFPDGVRFAHLAGLHDPALVPLAAADALGLHDHSEQPPLDTLVEQLRDRRLLLVLDNCEHLLSACAELAAALLHGTSGVRILATSRHRLALTEEHLLDVRPLPVPDPDSDLSAAATYPALALFADRAAAVAPGFELTPDNRAAVARLCRRLDGLPLAIELAAVRMRVLGVDQLVARLDDRYRLLTTGSPAVLPRHQTLRAAVDWSHELCTEAEQLVWARASVFAGSFDLEAAEAVCADTAADVAPDPAPDPDPDTAGRTDERHDTGDGTGEGKGAGTDDGTSIGDGKSICVHPQDVLEAVAGLVDKSVLSREGGPGTARYRLLDTLRHYGLDKLRQRPGEESAARRRQRDWAQEVAAECERRWFGPGQREIVARLRADQDNLRAALEFSLTVPGEARAGLGLAGTLWFYWHACGAPREGRYWLDRALDAHPEPTRERARALWVAGLLAGCPEDLTRGRHRAEDARALARRLGDPAEVAHAEYLLGLMALFGDDLPAALDHYEAAVARNPVDGQLPSLAVLDQVELAASLAFLGHTDRAVQVCENAHRLCEEHGEEWVRSYVLRVLALAYTERKEWDRAEPHARDALRRKLAVHDVIGIGLTLDLLVVITAARGAHERAAVLLGGADRVWAGIDGNRFGSTTYNSARKESETRVRAAVGPGVFDRAYRRGGGLGLTAIVSYALQEAGRPVVPGPRRADGNPHPDSGRGDPRLASLTRREREVAELVAEGLANQQIADRLVIARRTAEGHVERILGKLGFSNRSQIAAWVSARR